MFYTKMKHFKYISPESGNENPTPESQVFFSRLALARQSPCAYRHVENNRTTSAIGMHITNQLRRNIIMVVNESHTNTISVYPTTRFVDHWLAQCQRNSTIGIEILISNSDSIIFNRVTLISSLIFFTIRIDISKPQFVQNMNLIRLDKSSCVQIYSYI